MSWAIRDSLWRFFSFLYIFTLLSCMPETQEKLGLALDNPPRTRKHFMFSLGEQVPIWHHQSFPSITKRRKNSFDHFLPATLPKNLRIHFRLINCPCLHNKFCFRNKGWFSGVSDQTDYQISKLWVRALNKMTTYSRETILKVGSVCLKSFLCFIKSFLQINISVGYEQ